MGVIRPRPPATQNFASDRSANLADRQQIRRLLSTVPRAAATGGAGPFGTTRATATAWPGFAGALIAEWSTASMPLYAGDPPDWAPPSLTVPDPTVYSGALAVTEAGWYSMRAQIRGRFIGGTPANIRVLLACSAFTLNAVFPTYTNDLGHCAFDATVFSGEYPAPAYGSDNEAGDSWVDFSWDGSATPNGPGVVTAVPLVQIDFTRLR